MSRISEGVRAFLSSRMALRIRILLFSLLSILSVWRGLHSPLLATFGLSFVFFLFLFYDGSKKEEEEKGVGRSMSIFFYFFDSPFDEWRIRLFGIGWGVVYGERAL